MPVAEIRVSEHAEPSGEGTVQALTSRASVKFVYIIGPAPESPFIEVEAMKMQARISKRRVACERLIKRS